MEKAVLSYFNKGKAIVDVLLVNLAYLSSFWFRFGWEVPAVNFKRYSKLWPIFSLLALFSFWIIGLYENKRRNSFDLIWTSFLGSLLNLMLTMGLIYLLGIHSFPRTVLVLSAFILTGLLFVWRYFLSFWHPTKRVVIVGNNGETAGIRPKFENFIGDHSYQVVRVITSKDLPLKAAKIQNMDVICISASVPSEKRQQLMSEALHWNVELYVIPDLYEIMLKGAEVSSLDDSMYLRIKPLGLDPIQKLVKRLFDIFLALIGLILTLWLFPPIAIAIKLDSPGPVFYSQTRVGKDNKLFRVYKFRTMVADAEKSTGPVIALANDNRITRVGEFLRKTRLDELPQLWNVLKGEMSFVGPRPERPIFVEEFSKEVPIYRYRLMVKPGITGLAQVEGNYSTDFRDKLRYDLIYIRNYSVFSDLFIILKTIHVVLEPNRAKGPAIKVNDTAMQEVAVSKE